MSESSTYTVGHIRRQRELHAKSDDYGNNRHVYIHHTIRKLADELTEKSGHLPSMLDYGCGKGGFLKEMSKLGLFGEIAGYDPAVDAFATRPSNTFDVVTCLDVLDQTGPQYLNAVLDDVAKLTVGLAVFACLTTPKAATGLKPHRPFYWSHLVGQRMRVVATNLELIGIEGFERAVIIATPTL